MLKKLVQVTMAVMMLGAVQFVAAQEMQGMSHDGMGMQGAAAEGQMHQGHGMVNKVNAQSGKVNITHEPIESMGWPRMTMDFNVQDKAELANIKPGMKVDFDLMMKGKGYRITKIAPAK